MYLYAVALPDSRVLEESPLTLHPTRFETTLNVAEGEDRGYFGTGLRFKHLVRHVTFVGSHLAGW